MLKSIIISLLISPHWTYRPPSIEFKMSSVHREGGLSNTREPLFSNCCPAVICSSARTYYVFKSTTNERCWPNILTDNASQRHVRTTDTLRSFALHVSTRRFHAVSVTLRAGHSSCWQMWIKFWFLDYENYTDVWLLGTFSQTQTKTSIQN